MKDLGTDYLKRALALADELMNLANEGDAHRKDIGCGVVYGTLRDCAYKIRSLTESELELHQRQALKSQDDNVVRI